MKKEYVLLDKKDGLGTITLNRPKRYNVFAGGMREEILKSVQELSSDSDIRVIVITGKGKAFCAGGDVNEFVSENSKALSAADIATSDRLTMCKTFFAINVVEKPVITDVNDVAAGGGCNFALSCDMRRLHGGIQRFSGKKRTGF